jgi:hypothetical protein
MASLTESQAKALTELAGKLFSNPEVIKEIVADPRKALQNAGIPEKEIEDVLAYIKGLQGEIQSAQKAVGMFWM